MSDVVRLGVIGHRAYRHTAAVQAAVDAVLDRLSRDSGPVVVSSLAEGADRAVPARALRRVGARLEVVLPLPPDEYVRDFASAASRTEFDELLQRADSVEVVEAAAGASRELCYRLAAQRVVQRSDVLLALWDGQPEQGQGGTAETVRYAHDHEVPVEVVIVEREAR